MLKIVRNLNFLQQFLLFNKVVYNLFIFLAYVVIIYQLPEKKVDQRICGYVESLVEEFTFVRYSCNAGQLPMCTPAQNIEDVKCLFQKMLIVYFLRLRLIRHTFLKYFPFSQQKNIVLKQIPTAYISQASLNSSSFSDLNLLSFVILKLKWPDL